MTVSHFLKETRPISYHEQGAEYRRHHCGRQIGVSQQVQVYIRQVQDSFRNENFVLGSYEDGFVADVVAEQINSFPRSDVEQNECFRPVHVTDWHETHTL